jgi:hypothetical protein
LRAKLHNKIDIPKLLLNYFRVLTGTFFAGKLEKEIGGYYYGIH